uniref:C2 domain-containing protein n=1 Tax=Acrobeloides nanus TaxID=290746 RepID=A0A914C6M3_9BILA
MPSSPWKFNKNNNSDSTCDSPVLVPSPNTISPMPSISTHGSRRNSTIDDCGRFCALPEANGNAEVLVSLCYLENQGKLVVGLEKATGLEVPTLNKAPDTFAKISAVGQSGEEIGKHKTETIKACVDPNYGDSAVFSIHRNELENSNVQVQVFAHHGVLRRKIRIGYLCLGENSSSLDAQEHWQDMIQGMGTTVDKWHTLMKI